MDALKNLISGNSSKDEKEPPRHVPGTLSGEGSHFGSEHMPGSWDNDPKYEATKGTGISSAVPTSTSNAPHTSATSTVAAKGQGISSEPHPDAQAAATSALEHHYGPSSTSTAHSAPHTSSSAPTASGEYAGTGAAGIAGQSVPHSAQTTSLGRDVSSKPTASGEYAGTGAAGVAGQSVPHSAQTTSLGRDVSSKPTASGEYAGTGAAGVAGQSVPHSTQTTSLARDTSSSYSTAPQTSEYRGSSAPGVSGISAAQPAATTSAIPGAAAAGVYAANSGKPVAAGEYRGSEAPGVSGQSIPYNAKTTSAVPGAGAAAAYAANDRPTGTYSQALPDRSIASGTTSSAAAIGSTFTERSYALPSGDSTGPHVTATADRLDPHISGPSSTAHDAGLSHSNVTSSTQPSGTKISQAVPSDPISTAPLSSANTSAHHGSRDAALVGTAFGAAGTAAYEGNTKHSTPRDSGIASSARPGTTLGEHNPNGTDPHAVDRNFKDRVGGGDIVEDAQDPSQSKHHLGRDAAVGVGAASAGGLGAHELSRNHPSHAPATSQTSTGLGQASSAGTGQTSSISQNYGGNPLIVGGTAAAGTHASYLSQPQHATTKTPASESYGATYSRLPDGTPSGIAPSDPAYSSGITSTSGVPPQGTHHGRDAAIAGGVLGSTGVAAHELNNKPTTTTPASETYGTQYSRLQDGTPSGISTKDTAHPSTGITSTAPGNTSQSHHYGRDAAVGGTGLAAGGLAAHELSKNQKPMTTTPASDAHGTHYNRLPDGTPSGIAVTDTAHPGHPSAPGIKSSEGITSDSTSQHHYGRDAGVLGGTAAGTGLAAHELNKPSTTTPASGAYGTSYSRLDDGTPSGISVRDAAHPATGGLTSTTGHQHTGRDAALAGGTVGGAGGIAAYEASKHNTSKPTITSGTESSAVGGVGHTTLSSGTTSGIASSEAVHPSSTTGHSSAVSTGHTQLTSSTGATTSTTGDAGHIPKGYPFDSEKIERVADEAHGREHHPAHGEEKKPSLLDKLLHRDHPNKLHKEPDHAPGARTSHEAYDQSHSTH